MQTVIETTMMSDIDRIDIPCEIQPSLELHRAEKKRETLRKAQLKTSEQSILLHIH